MKDHIAKTLNLAPLEKIREEPQEVRESPIVSVDETVNDDIEFARKNILKLIDAGMFTVERLSELADCSQNSEFYKSVAPIIKSMLDANKELLAVHTTKKNLTGEDDKKTIVNNNLVLTTHDVLKLLRGDDRAGNNEPLFIEHSSTEDDDDDDKI